VPASPPDLVFLREWRCAPMPAGPSRLRVLVDRDPDPQMIDELRWAYRAEPVVEPVTQAQLDAGVIRGCSVARRGIAGGCCCRSWRRCISARTW
jgi:hypothetical protein